MKYQRSDLNIQEARMLAASMVDMDPESVTGFVLLAEAGANQAGLLTCCSAEHALSIMGKAIVGIAQSLGEDKQIYEPPQS